MAQPTDPLDTLSKLLFNAQHRLAVAGAFATADQALRYEDVVAATGVSHSVVHKELHVLAAIGAVQKVEVERGVYFQRAGSSFWALFNELSARATASSADAHRPLSTQG